MSGQVIFTAKMKASINTLDIRHKIEDDMESSGLKVDGGGMGGGVVDVFVDVENDKQHKEAIEIGIKIFKKHGVNNVETRYSDDEE